MNRLVSRCVVAILPFACCTLLHCTPKASSESVSSSGTARGEDAGTDVDGLDDEAPDDDGDPAAPDGEASDGDAWPRDGNGTGDGEHGPDAGGADLDASTDEGWTSTGDGDPNPDPDPNDGGTPGECRSLAPNTNSGSFGTVGSVCFTLSAPPSTAWEVYFAEGRTITVNGTRVSAGQMPFPGSAPYSVVFSAGNLDYTAWAYW